MLYAIKEKDGVKTLTPIEELTTVDIVVMKIKAFIKNLLKKIKLIICIIES